MERLYKYKQVYRTLWLNKVHPVTHSQPIRMLDFSYPYYNTSNKVGLQRNSKFMVIQNINKITNNHYLAKDQRQMESQIGEDSMNINQS